MTTSGPVVPEVNVGTDTLALSSVISVMEAIPAESLTITSAVS